MEEGNKKGEIIVKATAVVHDSHRPGLIYLRCIQGIIHADSESNDPGPPRPA